ARESRQAPAGSSAKRCRRSLRGAWGTPFDGRSDSQTVGLCLPSPVRPTVRQSNSPTAMIALARKYRPRKFADLIVQDHVGAALRGAVASDRVAHGYLFAGPRG